MSIGILYESEEWSIYELKEDIEKRGVVCGLVDMRADEPEEDAKHHSFIVNRVFPSGIFRDNKNAVEKMPKIFEMLKASDIPVINGEAAFYYDISKEYTTRILKENGFAVPEVFGTCVLPGKIDFDIKYPCIVKPDCGGRTNLTFIVKSEEELQEICTGEIKMIVEEYIEPVKGYLTRVEVIGGSCRCIMKRTVTESGLSGYHQGSVYYKYPECEETIRKASQEATELLQIRMGSLDIIEAGQNAFIIDVNATSNSSEDNIVDFGFDLMDEMAEYIVSKYNTMAKDKTHQLLGELDRLHTTKMGAERIKRNLSLGEEDPVEKCKEIITRPDAVIMRKGKNWYISHGKTEITVNAYSCTIITAHIL